MAATLSLSLDVANLERVVVRPGAEFTEDDFFDFCQEHELLRIERTSSGEIIIMAPVGTEGSFTESQVEYQLTAWARKDGRGIVLGPTAGITLPDGSVLSPDACWVPIETWRLIPPKKREKFAPLVPPFVIELRSRTDRKKDLHEKMLAYLRNGVELGWLIDPLSRTVNIYKPGQDQPTELNDPERVIGEGPVTGFVLDLKHIYDQLA